MLRYFYCISTLTITALPYFKQKISILFRGFGAYSTPQTSSCHVTYLWHIWFFILQKTDAPIFFLYYLMILYAFELFIFVLLKKLNFVNIQNNLKQTKAIKNNLVLAKTCHYKKSFNSLQVSMSTEFFSKYMNKQIQLSVHQTKCVSKIMS